MFELVPTNSLELRDVVKTSNMSPFSEAVVIGIEQDTITLYRPYVHTSDFSFGDVKVIPYIGTESFTISRSDSVFIAKWEEK